MGKYRQPQKQIFPFFVFIDSYLWAFILQQERVVNFLIPFHFQKFFGNDFINPTQSPMILHHQMQFTLIYNFRQAFSLGRRHNIVHSCLDNVLCLYYLIRTEFCGVVRICEVHRSFQRAFASMYTRVCVFTYGYVCMFT